MNILIVDDNKSVCNSLEKYVKKWFDANEKNININIRSFTDVMCLYSFMEDGNHADVIFMDIKLKEHNGIEIAKSLQEKDKGLACVFITGYPEYASDIFDANPIYFVFKPINEQKVAKVLNKLMEYRNQNDDKIFSFKIDEVFYRIRKRSIRYVEASGKNVVLYTDDGMYKFRASFTSVAEANNDRLIRCHRSYLVNPERIKKIDKLQIELYTGEYIPLSRRLKKEIQEKVCNNCF
ncbi:MAG: response regulator transcription factor [Lachnospiraceae bacterium]|nr:response regulator transcription factor [Lachnospiraceae bacterium]